MSRGCASMRTGFTAQSSCRHPAPAAASAGLHAHSVRAAALPCGQDRRRHGAGPQQRLLTHSALECCTRPSMPLAHPVAHNQIHSLRGSSAVPLALSSAQGSAGESAGAGAGGTLGTPARPTVVLATRGSRLAMAQTQQIADLLRQWAAQQGRTLEVQLRVVASSGDAPAVAGAPLRALGPGAFTKELDAQVAAGEADGAVHSLKDAPPVAPRGLVLAGCLPREDVRDVLLLAARLRGQGPQGSCGAVRHLADLPAGAVVGTASSRRKAQVLAAAPQARCTVLRGSVDARLAALGEGRVDATLLAVSGLKRLGVLGKGKEQCPGAGAGAAAAAGAEEEVVLAGGHTAVVLPEGDMLPAACQGAVGVVVREGDAELRGVLGSLCDAATLLRVTAERAALATLMEAAGTGVTAEPSTSPAAAAAQQVVGATQGPPAAASPAAMAQGQNSAGRRQEGEEGEAVLAMPGCAVACLATLSTGPQEGSGTTHGAAQIGECENSSSGSGSSDARRGPTVRLVLQSLVAQEEGSRLHRRCSTVSVPCAHGLASPEALHAAAALGRAEGTQLLALARSEGWVP